MIAIALAIIATVAISVRVVRQPPRGLEKTAAFVLRFVRRLRSSSLLSSLKIAFSFLQMVSVMPSIFQVSLSPGYQRFWNSLTSIELDWLSLFIVPAACFGDFGDRLLFMSLTPLIMVVVVFAGFVLWSVSLQSRHSRRTSNQRKIAPAVKRGLLQALPPALLLSFLLVPMVSKKIFSAFDCVSYEFDTAAGETKSFLRDDLSICEAPPARYLLLKTRPIHSAVLRHAGSALTIALHPTRTVCYETPAHRRIVAIAVGFVVVWPILVPILYVVLLFAARRAILGRAPSLLSRACSFLHDEYKPEVRRAGHE